MGVSGKRVELFLGPDACSCAGLPSPAKQEKLARAFALKQKLERAEGCGKGVVWDLGDDDKYEEGLMVLRGYLVDAGEDELAGRLAFSIGFATPSFAVDGRLVSIGDCPEPEEFLGSL